MNEPDALDPLFQEIEDYLGRTPVSALESDRVLGYLLKLSAGARIVIGRLSEVEFILKEARIACPLCRGKGYWGTDVYKNRPCHCKAGELFSSITKRAEDAERAMGSQAKNVRVGVAVVLRRGGEVLMGLRKGSHGAGAWSFPGGHLEPGETVQQCAARELAEETGIEIDSKRFKKLTFTNDIFENEEKHYVTLYVEVAPEPGLLKLNAKLLEPDKCDAWCWQDAPPNPLFLPIENLLKDGFRIWMSAP